MPNTNTTLLAKFQAWVFRLLLKLPVSYGCETWSLITREESRLRVFENGVLRRIFRPKREEVTGEWIRLHDEELYVPYFLPDVIWVIKSRRQDM
jgi:hypothetical protein